MKSKGWHLAPTAGQLEAIKRLVGELNYHMPDKMPATRDVARRMIAGFRLEKIRRSQQE